MLLLSSSSAVLPGGLYWHDTRLWIWRLLFPLSMSNSRQIQFWHSTIVINQRVCLVRCIGNQNSWISSRFIHLSVCLSLFMSACFCGWHIFFLRTLMFILTTRPTVSGTPFLQALPHLLRKTQAHRHISVSALHTCLGSTNCYRWGPHSDRRCC